nr:zinc finger, CCHC-type [Tanacetum cinerariifolium]
MRDKNPIRTLGDYSKPSHEGYMNTIELPVENNVVPLRSETIQLVQNGCSFHGLRSEDPNQHLKDFLKLMDSLDLNGENKERTRMCFLRNQASNWLERLPAGAITIWDDLTTCFLAYFFPPKREEEKSKRTDVTIGDDIKKLTKTETEMPVKKAKWRMKLKASQTKKTRKEKATEAPSSQPVEYYLKHRINEKLIEGLVDNHRHKERRKEAFHPRNAIPNNGKAVIKFDKGTITLRSGKSNIIIHRILESPYKSKKGVKNYIEHITPIMNVNRLVLEWKHPTPVIVEGGIDDEGEVM